MTLLPAGRAYITSNSESATHRFAQKSAPAALSLLQLVAYATLIAALTANYAYAKISFTAPELTAALAAGGATVLIGATLPLRVKRASDAVLWTLTTFLVVPSLALAAVGASYYTFDRWAAAGILGTGYLVLRVAIPSQSRPFHPSRWALSKRSFVTLIGALTIAALILSLLAFGTHAFDFSLDTVYQRRLLQRDTWSFPGISYAQTTLASLLVPTAVVVGIAWRRPALIVLGTVAGISVYAVDGSKSAPLLVLFTIAAFLSFSTTRSALQALWGIVLTAVVVVPTAIAVLTGWQFPAVLLTLRQGLMPAQLTIEYMNYASTSGFTFFTQHLLKWTLPESDRYSIGMRIGAILHPGTANNSNTNIWADGYVSAGLVGVIVTSLVMAAILHLFNRIGATSDPAIVGAIATSVCVAWVNVYLPTSLLTNGVLVALGLLRLLPARESTDPIHPNGNRGSRSTIWPRPVRRSEH